MLKKLWLAPSNFRAALSVKHNKHNCKYFIHSLLVAQVVLCIPNIQQAFKSVFCFLSSEIGKFLARSYHIRFNKLFHLPIAQLHGSRVLNWC